MKKYAIFGENILYSKSPFIHKLFFKEFNIKGEYKIYECDYDNFKNKLLYFFSKKNSLGANITVPFKEESLLYCNILNNNSIISKSINTIKKKSINLLKGYNTDGIGLIYHLKKINFIEKKYTILLIGAGGAAKGIIKNLSENSSKIIIFNRTKNKLIKIKNHFLKLGIKNIEIYNEDSDYKYKIDLLINATSSSSKNEIPIISNKIINKETKCYDLFYDIKSDTEFIKWCKFNGSKFCSDGLGMLIYQASYSFNIWNNLIPNTDFIFKKFGR